ncbi:MAG: hypothetical protein ACQKBT_01150 [Puniceicoccales bacterium]
MNLFRILVFAVCWIGTPVVGVAAGLDTVQQAQSEVQEQTRTFASTLSVVLQELSALGASEGDLELMRETIAELNQLTEEEMETVLAALTEAMERTEGGLSGGELVDAVQVQVTVVEKMRLVLARIRVRQGELSVAEKAERLRRRQAENQHRTEMVRVGRGDTIEAEAEQRAIDQGVQGLVREMRVILESARQDGQVGFDRESANPERMVELAKRAIRELESEQYERASQTQKELGELLADLAAEAGLEQSSKESILGLVQQLKWVRGEQQRLQEEGGPTVGEEQESLAVETESLRIRAESVNAPAGFQVGIAARSMRAAVVAVTAGPAKDPAADQERAILALERAIAWLEQDLEKMENEEGEGDPLAELAEMFQEAQQLERRQRAMSDGGQADQAQVARETAALQQEAQEHSPDAARELGRAAARMAAALDEELSQEERSRLQDAAADQLAAAVQSIQSKGRELRNSPPGPGTGTLASGPGVREDEELLGPGGLSPGEREAIQAARREPVSPEYAPWVEAYFNQLSRRGAENP